MKTKIADGALQHITQAALGKMRVLGGDQWNAL
jgi:hypothetical protein